MNRTTVFLAVVLLLSVGLGAVSGCEAGDYVQVKTPRGIQESEGLPARMSLNEAEDEYRAWVEDVQRQSARWKADIEKGDEIRGILNQLLLTGLDEIGPTIAGLPVAGPALPALTALAGLFIGRSPVRKEKEKSFNKGLERGESLARRERV